MYYSGARVISWRVRLGRFTVDVVRIREYGKEKIVIFAVIKGDVDVVMGCSRRVSVLI